MGFYFVILAFLFQACSRKKTPEISQPVWTHYQINAGVYDIAFQGSSVWVGTDRGLIRYSLIEDRITKVYGIEDGLISDVITVVKVDSVGHIWVGSHGGGVAEFDGKNWRNFNVPDLADPYVYDILFDKKGQMWVANWRGVSIYDGRRWRSFTKKDGIADDWVYALALDHQGVIWLGTERGVTRFDGKSFLTYDHDDGVGAEMKDIGDYERIPNPSIHHGNAEGKEAEGYNPNYILAAAVDHENVKWFGTWGAGLSRFDGRRWTNFTVRNGLPGNFISDILVDREGTVWVATDGGIGFYENHQWRKLTQQDGLLDDRVFTANTDESGTLWFGTLIGISRLDRLNPSG